MGEEDSQQDELKRINDDLLKRRAAARAELMEQYGDSLAEIKAHLAEGDYESARQLGLGLRETMLFEDVVRLFQEKPETFKCNACNNRIEGVRFKRETLTWLRVPFCEACMKITEEVQIEQQKEAFAEFIELDIKRILEAVGVSGRLLAGSYEGIPEPIVHTGKRAVMGKHGLYVYGDIGTGKSCLSVAVLKDVIQTSEHSLEIQRQLLRNIYKFREMYRFVHVPWLLEEMRASYGRHDYQGLQRIIDEYSKLKMLVLDDIGVEKPSSWVLEKINMIVDFRNNRELKTVYTSNKDPRELTEHLDKRITSRIFQQCEIILLTGPDRRRQ